MTLPDTLTPAALLEASETLAVNVGDTTLAVRRWANPGKPVLVLVHGYPDSSEIWLPLIGCLRADFGIITYDVRGAGRSDRPAKLADYSLPQLMADLHAVIDAASPELPVHVVGHDWGSIQSWEAVTEPGATRRIRSFTSISGPCLDHIGHWMQNSFRSLSPLAVGGALNQLAHSWYILLFQFPVLAPLLWQAGLGNVWPALLKHSEGIAHIPHSPTQTHDGIHGISLYRRNMLPRLIKPRARHAHVPVQMIYATQDRFISEHMVDVARPWVKQLWRRPVAATHWLQLSHPQALARWIRQFVTHIDTAQHDPELARYALHGRSAKAGQFAGQMGLITGAGSGIGRETALALARQGMQVICTDINEAEAINTAHMIREKGGSAEAFALDVADETAMDNFAAQLREHHGVPDVVINNAGIGMAGAFVKTSVKDWQKVLDVNLWGVIHGCRLFAQQMIEDAKPGHIVNIASAAAYTPSAAYPAYATTKAAVYMLTECLRAELARHHIEVSAICPGIIHTNITRNTRFVGDDPHVEQMKQQKTTQLYQRRAFTPDRVAKEIVEAICNKTPVVLVSPEAKGLNVLSRFAPGLLRKLARRDVVPA